MTAARLPDNETGRLRALRELAVLDTPPEAGFDDITALAAFVCQRPIALLSLVDAERQWFKSRQGLELTETPREVAFCAHAILNPAEVLVVPDAKRDERFADNPLVTNPPGLRFYAGAPLVTAAGEALGTLCVLDREAGEASAAQIDALRALARQAMAKLELRRGEIGSLRAQLEQARRQIQALETKLGHEADVQKALRAEHSFREAVIERAAEGVCVCHSTDTYPNVEFTVWNQRMTEITGYSMDEINRLGWYQTVYPDPELRQRAAERMERMRDGEDLRNERWEITRADGSRRALGISTSRLTSEDGLAHVLALMHDFTDEENLQREAMLARRDALTGVRSRSAFGEEAAMLMRLARRSGAPSALGFLDLDDLKLINDRMGHAEGDRVLACVGATLAESTRSTDVVGRVGGDEFAVLLPETEAASAQILFDRLHERLRDSFREHGWPVGVSVGVAFFAAAPPSEADALSYADRLMYQAKRDGKNRVVYGEFRAAGEGGAKRPVEDLSTVR